MELRTKKDMFGNIVWKDAGCWIPKTEWVHVDKEEDNEPKDYRQDTPKQESDTGKDIYGA